MFLENIDIKNNLLLLNVYYDKNSKYINFDKYATETKNIYNFYYIKGYLIPMELYFDSNELFYVNVQLLIKRLLDNNIYKVPAYVELHKKAYNSNNIISEIIKGNEDDCAIIMEYVAKEFKYAIKDDKTLMRMIKIKTLL